MSVDFYDHSGNPYAYCDDGEHIYTFKGKPIAYISDESIYRFDGKHVGYFSSGILRDEDGNALLFTDGATGGPVKPVKRVKPVKGVTVVRPVKGVKAVRPVRPVNTLHWSQHAPARILES
jgi:hypothetical protein